MMGETVSQIFEEEQEHKIRDILALLSHAWKVEGENEIDAIYNAIETASGVSRLVFEEKIRVKRLDATLFKVINTEKNTSIIARVTEEPERSYGAILPPYLMGIRIHSGDRKNFIVTFYPRTYSEE